MNLSDLLVTYYIFSKDKVARREQVQIKVKQKFIFRISSKGAEVRYKISRSQKSNHNTYILILFEYRSYSVQCETVACLNANRIIAKTAQFEQYYIGVYFYL